MVVKATSHFATELHISSAFIYNALAALRFASPYHIESHGVQSHVTAQ